MRANQAKIVVLLGLIAAGCSGGDGISESDAIEAMGAESVENPLNHPRYQDEECLMAVEEAGYVTGAHTLDTTLDENEVENYVTNEPLDLAAGTTVGGQPIGTSMLDESTVETWVTNGPLDLDAGTTLNRLSISTGPHTVDTTLDEPTVEGYVTNAAIDLAVGSTLGGATISTGAHVTDTTLDEATVESYVTNGVLDLASGTTIGGASIATGSHTIDTNAETLCSVGQLLTGDGSCVPVGLASVDSVAAPGGDVDFVAGTNMSIVPDAGNALIGFSADIENMQATAVANEVLAGTAPDTAVADMQLTAAEDGTYLVWFSSSISNENNGRTMNVSLYVDGALVPHTVRRHVATSDRPAPVATQMIQGLTAGQVVQIYWSNSANAATMYERTLSMIRLN